MTAVVDYGVGNLFSLLCSLNRIGEKAEVTGDSERILKADRIILPGVGAFGDAADKLRAVRLDEVITDAAAAGKPLLGICLGMQLLFDESEEFGIHKGLGLIPGRVVPLSCITDKKLKIPHMGWNSLTFGKRSRLFRYIGEYDDVYFVHSYCAVGCEEYTTASVEYGADVTAAVEKDNIAGFQFHPEKSGRTGLMMLKAFCENGGSVC